MKEDMLGLKNCDNNNDSARFWVLARLHRPMKLRHSEKPYLINMDRGMKTQAHKYVISLKEQQIQTMSLVELVPTRAELNLVMSFPTLGPPRKNRS